MKVLKFGGTSVGSPEMLENVAEIVVKASQQENVVLVVSAFSGVTNLLEEIAATAVENSVEGHLRSIEKRHLDMVDAIIKEPGSRSALSYQVKELVSDLNELCTGVGLLNEITSRTRARILSAGELMSSAIISVFLKEAGLEVSREDSRDYFVTSGDSLSGDVNLESTFERLTALQGIAPVIVLPGFIARDEEGNTSTLGRGGSDYTAALVASALSATELEIWTDVSGVMTADPRSVRGAHVIDRLNYEEAMELSYFGAKVIYPPTMQPLIRARVPLVIKNTRQPDDPGTVITGSTDEESQIVKGISSIPGIALITVAGPGMIGVPGTAKRMFDALARRDLNVLFITQSSSEHTITVGIDETDCEVASEELNHEFERELYHSHIDRIIVEGGLALIAAVGEGMKRRPGVSGKLFSLLGDNGINIRAIAQGSTERNVSFVVKEADSAKAVNVLHEGFFLSPVKVAHIYAIGVGNVGAQMLKQLEEQQAFAAGRTQCRGEVGRAREQQAGRS